ncbi:helix-turn-helix domain-containing protein [Aquamicrobium zhengzhouense]|uniref:Cupin domain-containing protein n=1 Tax=Aquamicrobium zhengzhouense TaxID=2781738 RepID=A0ABS0SFT3_9HYPH|nr:cupin domain-containing protein [Aquamicrobium zhengzhouense]MBI1621639.1 cupin domain-containing protein [Aquamicrobium zhengzhouense]
MLSDTLTTELERYQIGPRIRAMRLKKKMGLVQLGEHTGMSPAMLSKIERGQLFPTLPTLLRIALVFGVELNHFFSRGGPRVAITRRKDRLRLPIPAGSTEPSYLFESINFPLPDRKLESYVAVFPVDASASEPHQHGSEEMLYVLSGVLTVRIEEEAHILEEGDAIAFDSSLPHSYEASGADICSVLVVTVN